jgi:sulfite oxidase
MGNPGVGAFPDGEAIDRRTLLRMAAGAAGVAMVGPAAAGWADEVGAGLIVRNSRPLDLETPVTALDRRWLTPNELFFVRSHLSVPAVDLVVPWSVEVGGLADRPVTIGLADLDALQQVTIPAVLQCSGNGRANFRPIVPGVSWDRGAVGHAEWTGVRLRDLLERVRVKAGAAHVHTLGADAPPSPKTPAYLRSIPLEKALDPSTILATRMNGDPLPVLHGGPVRLVVPGWTGNHWMKWLRRLTISADEAPGTYQQSGYKMPKVPAPPGADLKPSDLVSLTTMNVKSLITHPAAGTVLKPGRHEVRGVAWTGDGHVTKVEFSTEGDGSSWSPATLQGEPRMGSWRMWRATWDVKKAGRYTLLARATDSNGQVQPETVPWNRSGYLWNGYDRVTCEVRGDA